MRAFRSKSLSLRSKKEDGGAAADAMPDLASLIPDYAQRVKQQQHHHHHHADNQHFYDLSAPVRHDSVHDASHASRPFTPSGWHRRLDTRGSFSRPRTAASAASSAATNRRNLVVDSLRRHDIDPSQSCLLDDGCIGMALGSPTESSFGAAATAPVAASPVVPTVRLPDVDPSLQAGLLEHRQQQQQQQQQRTPDSTSRTRSSTWKTMSGLFGRKRHAAVQQQPPPPPPLPLPPPHATESIYITPVQSSTIATEDFVDDDLGRRPSSHFSRRRKSDASHRSRKSLSLRRRPRVDVDEDTVPSLPPPPPLPTEKFPAIDAPSLQQVDIPTFSMDRFSVMFAPVLQKDADADADAVPEKNDFLSTAVRRVNAPSPRPGPRLSSLLPPEMTISSTSPQLPAADTTRQLNLNLAPAQLQPKGDKRASFRQRSATAPSVSPDPIASRAPPPPPLPLAASHTFPAHADRSPSFSSHISISTSSLIRSPASSTMGELEDYYLPPRYQPNLADTDDNLTSSSSRSSRTFSTHRDHKPAVPFSFPSSASSPALSTPPDFEHEMSSTPLLTRQSTDASVQSSTYLSARAYPSPTSSTHALGAASATSPSPVPLVGSHRLNHNNNNSNNHHLHQPPTLGHQSLQSPSTVSPINPYSPSAVHGYNDPHSPLLELARSSAVQQARGVVVRKDSSQSSRPATSSQQPQEQPLHVNQARCGTPQLVLGDGRRRTSTQALLDY